VYLSARAVTFSSFFAARMINPLVGVARVCRAGGLALNMSRMRMTRGSICPSCLSTPCMDLHMWCDVCNVCMYVWMDVSLGRYVYVRARRSLRWENGIGCLVCFCGFTQPLFVVLSSRDFNLLHVSLLSCPEPLLSSVVGLTKTKLSYGCLDQTRKRTILLYLCSTTGLCNNRRYQLFQRQD
jgi:hypothetical protein